MPRQDFTAAEAARALGISLDTLRRWDRSGKIRVERDAANRRVVAAAEVERLRAPAGEETLSARNHFRGIVRSIEVDGLLARVEIDVTEPARVVADHAQQRFDRRGFRDRAAPMREPHDAVAIDHESSGRLHEASALKATLACLRIQLSHEERHTDARGEDLPQ